jgi:hypothetical protein
MDVIYAAVLGYGAYEIGKSLEPVFGNPPSQPSWGTLLLLGFVTYYLIADVVEARVYNELFKYQGRDRFLTDVLVAGCFLTAYMAGGRDSTATLLALGGTMLGGGVWAVFLENETKKTFHWGWPRILAVSHLAGGCVFVISYCLLYRNNHFTLSIRDVLLIWGFYAAWDVTLIVTVRQLKIPVAEADLLPLGLIASLARLAGRAAAFVWTWIGGRV